MDHSFRFLCQRVSALIFASMWWRRRPHVSLESPILPLIALRVMLCFRLPNSLLAISKQ